MSIANFSEDFINDVTSKIANITGGIVDDARESITSSNFPDNISCSAVSGTIHYTSVTAIASGSAGNFTFTNPNITANSQIYLIPTNVSQTNPEPLGLTLVIQNRSVGSCSIIYANFSSVPSIDPPELYLDWLIVN